MTTFGELRHYEPEMFPCFICERDAQDGDCERPDCSAGRMRLISSRQAAVDAALREKNLVVVLLDSTPVIYTGRAIR